MDTVEIFSRLLGLVYFAAFFPFIFQIRALIGENGILPLQKYLNFIALRLPKEKYYYFPTLFWFNASNKALMSVAFLGTFLSIVLMIGYFTPLALIGLYVLYLSIVWAGQIFLGYGWEGFLLEITIHAFLLNLTPIPDTFVWISIYFLLFRFHVQAGAVKLQSKDPYWRNLTATYIHYESQPLPNPLAWYMRKMPLWFHKASCLYMFFVEMVVPFAIFFGPEIRFVAFTLLVSLQLMIAFTGNFSFLNLMTIVLCTVLLGVQPTEVTWVAPFGILLLTLQAIRFANHFFPRSIFERILQPFQHFFLVNRYGLFAVMTVKRYEIIPEGSDDMETWKPYGFRFKPDNVTERPPIIAPFQPRLDWQMWFLPFALFDPNSWFQSFLSALLEGNKEVLKLVRINPFPDKPPKYIRARAYLYEYTSWAEGKLSKAWYKRKDAGLFTPTLTLKNPKS